MSAREEILARLGRAARPAPDPAPWTSVRRFEDLADRFAAALTAALGEVRRVRDPGEARETLGHVLDDLGARRVVAQGDDVVQGVDLEGLRSGIHWHRVGKSAGDLRAACAAADVGVSGAAAGLAETGTVVLASGPGMSRLATLLPPVQVVLLPAARLTADLFTWTAARRGSFPSQVVLVSGPSKTADIEQTLAVGVHGPGRLIVILTGEPAGGVSAGG